MGKTGRSGEERGGGMETSKQVEKEEKEDK